MKRIDEIIVRYLKAQVELNDIIQRLANGDWSKADLLYNNNERVRELYDEMHESLSDFEYETSAGDIYTFSDDFSPFVELMRKASYDKGLGRGTIQGFLEHMRDDWASKIESGEDLDYAFVEHLDYFFKLPNCDPDAWVKRKFLLQGVYLSPDAKKLPKSVVEGFAETCTCFIYGNFLATCAMARSVLELMLRTEFKISSEVSLNEILENWGKIGKLRKNMSYRDKAKQIQRTGNASLHEGNDEVRHIFNEMMARTVLDNLRGLIEFIYR